MSDSAGIERRLAAALARIAVQIDRGAIMAPASTATGQTGHVTGHEKTGHVTGGEADELREALESERAANAQLTERVRAIKEKQETMISALERKVARLSEQLAGSSAELQRQKRVNTQLTDANRALTEAAQAGITEPHLLNRSMMTELEALRAARAADVAEMNEILAELKPLLGEVA